VPGKARRSGLLAGQACPQIVSGRHQTGLFTGNFARSLCGHNCSDGFAIVRTGLQSALPCFGLLTGKFLKNRLKNGGNGPIRGDAAIFIGDFSGLAGQKPLSC
jgi:hypothetical protein